MTMSTAVIEGLRSVGGKRLAVATAYDEEVNRRLQMFLHEEGFEVLTIRGLGVQRVEDIHQVTRDGLFEFSAKVFESTQERGCLAGFMRRIAYAGFARASRAALQSAGGI